MLKKLASLLFEEEEVEEPAPKPIKKKVQEPDPVPVSTPVIPERTFESIVADEPETVREPIHTEPVKREPLFVDAPKPTPSKPTPTKPVTASAPYEFRPLISPIFGVSEHEQAHRPTFSSTAEVQNDSHLQTVISPYYGAIHKDPKTKPEGELAMPAAPVVEKPVSTPQASPEPEPVIENLALEALLEPDPIPTEASSSEHDDHEQFSLFGDEQ